MHRALDVSHREELLFWIRTATHGLCAIAKERIAREVQAHYEAALDDYVAKGETPWQAHRRALDGLGDPEAACRGFERTYLTAKEDRIFRSIVAPLSGRRQVVTIVIEVCLILSLCAVSTYVGFRNTRPLLEFAGVWSVYLLIETFFIPYLFRRGYVRRAIIWQMVLVPLWTVIGLCMMWKADMSSSFWLFFMLTVFCSHARPFLPILQKIERAQQTDIPIKDETGAGPHART
jgi:hypothetical protein